jgi:hypothetical protein
MKQELPFEIISNGRIGVKIDARVMTAASAHH